VTRLIAWARTDTGRKRDHNEDSYLVDEGLGLFAVADGMGGHQGGETASRMALQVVYDKVAAVHGDMAGAAREIEAARREEILKRMAATDDTDEQDGSESEITGESGTGGERALPAEESWGRATPTSPLIESPPAPAVSVMRAAAREASWAIFDTALGSSHLRGMGTTLTAMLYADGRMHVIHAGDSRCYLFRDNGIRQITDDHSWIAEQVRSGNLTEAEAKSSRYRHVITRSVGFERDVEADVRTVAVEAGDCFLLCSDGLTNCVDNVELERILSTTWLRRAPQYLVDLANQRGGDDNVTVVAVMVANEELDELPASGS